MDCEFGDLRGRWHYLRLRLKSAEQYISYVTIACYGLHNICESLADGWEVDVQTLS